jgi:hypothetical protein
MRKKIMTSWVLAIIFSAGLVEGSLQVDVPKIEIFDTGEFFYIQHTDFKNLGPQVGDILNFHYFPGLKYYQGGRYSGAYTELSYFIEHVGATNGNPNQAHYLSTAHYIRGMSLLYHASGIGRLILAKSDFEDAIMWDAMNYPAYVELSRVLLSADLKDQAAAILRQLIELKPGAEVLREAQKELNNLQDAQRIGTNNPK